MNNYHDFLIFLNWVLILTYKFHGSSPVDLDRIITKKMNPKTDLSLGFAIQENIGLDKQYFAGTYEINWEPKTNQKMSFRIAD